MILKHRALDHLMNALLFLTDAREKIEDNYHLSQNLKYKKTFKDLVWVLLLEFHGAVNFQTPK